MGKREQRVRQATVMLPSCDYEAPVLFVDESMLSIPVIALCEMLGLCMFYGMWTVCYLTRETETSLRLLLGRFLQSTDKRYQLFYAKGHTNEVS